VDQKCLWAPWRLGYVTGQEKTAPRNVAEDRWLAGADRDCFICRGVADDADRQNLLVRRGTHVVTVLNRYPYNNGHLLIAPQAHKARLDEITPEESWEVMRTITDFVGTLERLMNAEGFNIGLNLGRVAGAGLPGHLHWHVVPRFSGDTNFMPAVAGVKSIPQSLDALWQLLTEASAERT